MLTSVLSERQEAACFLVRDRVAHTVSTLLTLPSLNFSWGGDMHCSCRQSATALL